MKYLSVCSGIEAATVAWHPLGWTPVGFSEIEPFPCAVLAHHYPDTPNFGDMTKHEQWNIEPGTVDLLVGGTPCQSFSVAGLRQGLKDPRGNLMLTFLAIAARLRPRWIVWENVPGVLSSNGGRDFGTFLGALGELGYGFAYRVLDAQWVRTHGHPRAVPQRRRRVFVVGCLRDFTSAAKVLFERESLSRYSSSRRAAGQTVAGTIAARSGESRNNPEQLVAYDQQRQGQYGDGEVASTKAARDFKDATDLIVIDRAAFNQGANAMYPPHIEQTDVMDPLVARGPHAVAVLQPVEMAVFTKSKRAKSKTDNETWVEGVVAPTQNAFDIGDKRATTAVLFENHPQDSRVTGPHDVAPSCVSQYGTGGGNVPLVIPIQDSRVIEKKQNGIGVGNETSPAYTIDQTGAQAVAIAIPIMPQAMQAEGWRVGKENQDGRGNGLGVGKDGDPCPTLDRSAVPAVAIQGTIIGRQDHNGPQGSGHSESGEMFTLNSTDVHAVAVGCFKWGAGAKAKTIAFSETESPTIGVSGGSGIPAVAIVGQVDWRTTNNDAGQVSQTLKTDLAHQSGPCLAVAPTMQVRRLTPTECERLQGFPDGWTAIPWKKKSAEDCPDGPRYKALGNSMAVNCMAWIGERIAAVDATMDRP